MRKWWPRRPGKEAGWVSHQEGSFGARRPQGAGLEEQARSAHKAAFTALLTKQRFNHGSATQVFWWESVCAGRRELGAGRG